MIGLGDCPPLILQFRPGSSASAVPDPISMASWLDRSQCVIVLVSSCEINVLSPGAAAIRLSRDWAYVSVKKLREVFTLGR